MTEREKYLFDLQGYLLIEDVISDADCALAREKIKERMIPREKTPNGYDPKGTWFHADKLLDVGQPFIDLIDNEKIIPIMKAIIDPTLRLECAYSYTRTKGCPPFEIHGGFRGGSVNFRYNVSNDQIYTGLTVVSFALQDVSAEDGGFACIPGSHKSDFRVPQEDREELFDLNGPLVKCISTPKGSAVIFTETLAHGANSWQNDTPRYGLFYKYNDRAAIYADQNHWRPNQDAFDMMTEEQKCYFNTAWQAFGPDGRHNTVSEFG